MNCLLNLSYLKLHLNYNATNFSLSLCRHWLAPYMTLYSECDCEKMRQTWHWVMTICTNWVMTKSSQQSLKNCLIIIITAIICILQPCSCVRVCDMPRWFIFILRLICCVMNVFYDKLIFDFLESILDFISLSLSVLQFIGSVSMWSRAPSWKVAPPLSTCATTCWSSPEVSPLSLWATGSCQRCVDTVPCQMASCSRGALAVDTVSNRWTFGLTLTLWSHTNSLQL